MLHEVIIGLPLRGIRVPLAFVAMVGQVPLIKIFGTLLRSKTKTGPFAQLGNYIFWFTFCFLGQPAAVLLYYYQAATAAGARTAHCARGLLRAAHVGATPSARPASLPFRICRSWLATLARVRVTRAPFRHPGQPVAWATFM